MKKPSQMIIVAVISTACCLLANPALAEKVRWNGIWVEETFAAAHPVVPGTAHPVEALTDELAMKTDELATKAVVPEMPMPETYGTVDWSGYTAGPCDAFVRTGSVEANNENCEKIEPITDGYLSIGFPVHLPQGASIQKVRIDYYGNSTSVNISAGLYRASGGAAPLIASTTPAAYANGNAYAEFSFLGATVNNSPVGGGTYSFNATLNRIGSAVTGIHSVSIYYKLQVSPAPAIASFTDVPTTHPYFQYVEALRAPGITGGCGVGLYCPERAVTRGEMAVFLSLALGLHFGY